MTWRQIKIQKALLLGNGKPWWYCEQCGRYLGDNGRFATGHHIDHNHHNNTLENCFLRCVDCEQSDPHTYIIDARR